MGRPEGTRNAGYDERKTALARAVLPRVLADDGARASLQELADAAGASVPTLKHYFGSRSGVVAAALEGAADLARDHVEQSAVPSSNDLGESMRELGHRLVWAWQAFGVGRFFAGGLAASIYDAEAGPGYVNGVLEPTQQAIERRLAVHVERGEADIQPDAIRAAALQFLAPIFVALLHQDPLSGKACRPLDVNAFVDVHIDAFVRAWGAAPIKAPRSPSPRVRRASRGARPE